MPRAGIELALSGPQPDVLPLYYRGVSTWSRREFWLKHRSSDWTFRCGRWTEAMENTSRSNKMIRRLERRSALWLTTEGFSDGRSLVISRSRWRHLFWLRKNWPYRFRLCWVTSRNQHRLIGIVSAVWLWYFLTDSTKKKLSCHEQESNLRYPDHNRMYYHYTIAANLQERNMEFIPTTVSKIWC